MALAAEGYGRSRGMAVIGNRSIGKGYGESLLMMYEWAFFFCRFQVISENEPVASQS